MKKCCACKGNNTIRWSIRNGKQRYRCKDCGALSTWNNKGVGNHNRFVWSGRRIEGKQTIEQLSSQSGYSVRSLKRYFSEYLSESSTWKISHKESVNLLIDGTYFANKVCLVLYRESTIKTTLFYRLSGGEWFEELLEDLRNILSLEICIESVTCDGLSRDIQLLNFPK